MVNRSNKQISIVYRLLFAAGAIILSSFLLQSFQPPAKAQLNSPGRLAELQSEDKTDQALLVSPNIVISQIYGGTGCGTAGCSTYKNDYIELFNRGASSQSLNGWSVQYAAATGTAWQVTT